MKLYHWAVIVSAAILVFVIRTAIVAEYTFERSYLQLWELADKSSTIPAKQKYVGEFLAALESGYTFGQFASHDALWLKTPNNGFAENLEALRTLAHRLNEISDMDPSSFEYNTAMQQITAQEQGEADAMIGVFSGCYKLENFTLVWGWIGGTIAIVAVLGFLASLCWWMFES